MPLRIEDNDDDSEDSSNSLNHIPSSRTSITNNVSDVFISSVAAETSVDPAEMESSTRFSDLDVESLMGIAFFKGRADTMLPASFFGDYPTVADARKALGCAP